MTKELRNDRMDVERWKAACKAGSCQANYRRERGLTEARDDYFVDGVQWADEHPAQTQWRTVDEWPKDKEWILMMLDNGRLQATQWDDDGKGFNSGYAELNFSGGAMMRLPVEYKVVAWRPLADVANEYVCHGTLAKQPEQPNQTTDGYAEQQQWMVDSKGGYGGRPMRIVGAGDTDGFVSVEMQDGFTFQPRLDTLRRWVIGDACNGDVLVCRHPKGHEGSRESIFIFREVADRDYVSHAVEYHCRLFDGEFLLAGQGYMGTLEKASDSDHYRPATAAETKQMWEAVQRAGYEWDAESGKLRDIK